MKERQINILKGIGAIVFYFLTCATNLNVYILKLLNIDYVSWPMIAKYAYTIIYQVIVCIIVILIFKETFKRSFTEFKNNFKLLVNKYIKYWFMALGAMMASNIIIQMIQSGIAPNEQAVQETVQMAPLYAFISAVILAPFLEETIFRLAIKKIIPKPKWVFIFTSGIIFGLMHIVGHDLSIWTNWLFIVPYSIPGIFFAYALYKSDNICIPIFLHTVHNGILITIQLLNMFL